MSFEWVRDALGDLDRRHLRRRLGDRSGAQSATIEMDGKRLINFGSNDYLGLANDPRVLAAVATSLETFGWGSAASPLVSGRSSAHGDLERALAEFEGTAAALLFPTGYAANVATIVALAERKDAICSDAKNHASIIDGCRLSGAEVFVYRHADVESLREALLRASSARRRLVVTDGIFSMDGDVAPLQEIAAKCRDADAMLLVDEAHATGVLGDKGRGAAERCGIEDIHHVRVGTLSKGLGSLGGFVAGSQEVIDWIAHRGRAFVFSTATPAACCAAAHEALRIVRAEPQRRALLLERAARFRRELQRDGWNTGTSETQIIPVILGSPDRTQLASNQLRGCGLYVPGIRPPSVPTGESLLRISLSYAHTDEMLDQLRQALRRAL